MDHCKTQFNAVRVFLAKISLKSVITAIISIPVKLEIPKADRPASSLNAGPSTASILVVLFWQFGLVAAHVFNEEHSGSLGGSPVHALAAVPAPRVQRVLDTPRSQRLHRLATHRMCFEAAMPRN